MEGTKVKSDWGDVEYTPRHLNMYQKHRQAYEQVEREDYSNGKYGSGNTDGRSH